MNKKYLKIIKKELISLSFLAPGGILFILFVLMPFIKGIPYSLTDWDGFSPKSNFVGFNNYKALFSDGSILIPLKNTLLFAVVTVIGSNVMGLILALAIFKNSRLNSTLRTIFFMPFVLSLVLSAFIWSFIYSDVSFGLLGIPSLLGKANTVIPGLAIISIWRDSGYCMIVYLAALKLVPFDYYEAASIEGCGKIKMFFKITMPLIIPAFTANATLLLAWGLKLFDYPMAATGGGPGNSSESLAIFIFRNIFEYYKSGYGQAASVVFTVFIFIISFAVSSTLRKREVEM